MRIKAEWKLIHNVEESISFAICLQRNLCISTCLQQTFCFCELLLSDGSMSKGLIQFPVHAGEEQAG